MTEDYHKTARQHEEHTSHGICTLVMEKLHKIWQYISKASDNPVSGTCFAVLSTVLLSLGHFDAQLAILPTQPHGMSSYEIVLLRNIEQVVMLVPFLLVYRSRVLFGSDKWLLIFFISLSGYLCEILLYATLTMIPISISLAISATCPFFATLFSIFILKERCSYLSTACGIVSFIGVILIARPTFHKHSSGKSEEKNGHRAAKVTYEFTYILGCCLALVFGMTRALYLVLARKWRRQSEEADSSPVLTVFFPSILGLVCTPFILIFSGNEIVAPKETYRLFSLLSVGLLSSFGLLCLTLALKSQNATIVGLIRNLEVVWGFLLQYFIMGYEPTWWVLGGAALIIIITIIAPVSDTLGYMLCGRCIYNESDGDASEINALIDPTDDNNNEDEDLTYQWYIQEGDEGD